MNENRFGSGSDQNTQIRLQNSSVINFAQNVHLQMAEIDYKSTKLNKSTTPTYVLNDIYMIYLYKRSLS